MLENLQKLLESGISENIELAFVLMKKLKEQPILPTWEDFQAYEDTIGSQKKIIPNPRSLLQRQKKFIKNALTEFPEQTVIKLSTDGHFPNFMRWMGHLNTIKIGVKNINDNIVFQLPEYYQNFQHIEAFSAHGHIDLQQAQPLINKAKTIRLNTNKNIIVFPSEGQILYNLEDLYVTELDNLERLSFALMPNLKYLTIKGLNIKFPQCDFSNAKNLININILDVNCLQILPTDFYNLAALEALLLVNCPLSEISPAIRQLTNLNFLFLHATKIKKIPENICELPNLHTLRIAKSYLSELPNNIDKMQALNELTLFENKLTNLPENLVYCKNLEKVNISNNKISQLPTNLAAWKSLKFLNLGNNNFSNLPDNIDALQNLEELHIDENPIKILPTNMLKMNKLDKLYGDVKQQRMAIFKKMKKR